MSGLSRRRYPRRTYKRRRAYSRRPIYRRRSYKRRRFSVGRGLPRRSFHARGNRRFVNLTRVMKHERGRFKVSSWSATGRLNPTTTVRVPSFTTYNFTQNTTNVVKFNSMSPIAIPPFTGLDTEVYSKFLSTRVVCSRLTVYVERQDGVDISPWEFTLTPLNSFQYISGVSAGTLYTQAPSWTPTGVTGTEARYQTLRLQKGSVSRTLGAPAGGLGPLKIRLSSTVMQSAMNLDPGDYTNSAYTESSSAGVSPNGRLNWWMLSAFCQNPTASGTHDFTLQIKFTAWIRAWQPRLTYELTASGPAPISSDPEGKEEKKEPLPPPEDSDDESALDQFVDLRMVEAPKRPSMAPPSPAPASSGSELRRTVSRAIVRP